MSGLVAASRLTTTPQPYVIDGVIPETGVGFFFAPSGTGKTFGVLGLGLRVSNGWDWCGHKVKKGTVVMGLCEGQGDAGIRLMGAQIASKEVIPAKRCRKNRQRECTRTCHCTTTRALSESNFAYIMKAYRLDVDGELKALKQYLKILPDLRLLILDHATGHSNGSIEYPTSGKRFMMAAHEIAQEFGIFVLIVHHMDKAKKNMRGTQVLWDMADVIIKMDDGALLSEKAKSDGEFDPIEYELENVAWQDPEAVDEDNPDGDVSTLAFRWIDTSAEMEAGILNAMKKEPRFLPDRIISDVAAGNPAKWAPVKPRDLSLESVAGSLIRKVLLWRKMPFSRSSTSRAVTAGR